MKVNFFGPITVSRVAMPHLRATRGRLITISSIGGVVGQPFNETYCTAKAATEAYMESLAPVAAEVGVTVSVVEPGPVKSAFRQNLGIDREAMLIDAGAYAPALQNYLKVLQGLRSRKALGHRRHGSATSHAELADGRARRGMTRTALLTSTCASVAPRDRRVGVM
jgi:NAD(P)-dependent dehydrogenase (short-subunit alcohol dehydrogenase family)